MSGALSLFVRLCVDGPADHLRAHEHCPPLDGRRVAHSYCTPRALLLDMFASIRSLAPW